MQNSQQQNTYIQEDEIDLRELWHTIVKSRVKIAMITTGVVSKKKQEYPIVDKISVVKGTSDLIEITVQGLDNSSCVSKIETIIDGVKKTHKSKIDEFLSITNEKLKALTSQKELLQQEIQEIKDAIGVKNSKHVTLASLILMKDLNSQLSQTLEKINNIKITVSQNSIKNTELIGEIGVSEYPIKPKKKLIVIVAFVTGLILSIFLVFFLEFISGVKGQEEI